VKPLLAHSITAVPDGAVGHPLVCGSHGGLYAALCALQAGVSAVVFNDAGFGKDRAGVAGLAWLDSHGVAAAAVSHRTARIGDAADSYERGVISAANSHAEALGARVGQRVRALWPLLKNAHAPQRTDAPSRITESRFAVHGFGSMAVLVLDSNSLVVDADRDAAVVTGSHGGLVGGDSASAIRHDVFAAIYNDAHVGIDAAGIGRLVPLDARGIAAATVSAASARIGDGRSTLDDGVVSHVNARAATCGGRVGQTTRELLHALAAHHPARTAPWQ